VMRQVSPKWLTLSRTEHDMKGCGKQTHVAGTNGGTMPCGAMLTNFGKTEPYYCGACQTSQSEDTLTKISK
jgi:hypothetical protein